MCTACCVVMVALSGRMSTETGRRSPWRRALITGCMSWTMCIYVIAMQPPEKRAAIWTRLSGAFSNASGIGDLVQDPHGHLQYVLEQEHLVKYVALFVLFKLLARVFRKRVERASEAHEKKED